MGDLMPLRRAPSLPAFRGLTRPATRSEIQRAVRPAVFRGAASLPRAPGRVQRRVGAEVGMFKRVSRRI